MRNLRIEDEIIASWQGSIEHPLVSVCCAAYNHEPFIEEALVGFLEQETHFPYEILIHDDASTDRTPEVIRRYHERYPRIIKPIFQTQNQYSQGRRPATFNNSRARGDFLATCEGDDCWIHPQKLQRQVEAMERFPEADICIHKAEKINYRTGEKMFIGEYRNSDGIIPLEDIILKRYGQIPTASTLVRKDIIKEMSEFREARPWLTVGDLYLHFFGAKRGGAVYIDEPMSLYRSQTPGSWNDKLSKSQAMFLEHVYSRLKSYEELDDLTAGHYTHTFQKENKRQILDILKSTKVSRRNKIKFFYNNLSRLSFGEQVMYLPLVLFPNTTLFLHGTMKTWLHRINGAF